MNHLLKCFAVFFISFAIRANDCNAQATKPAKAFKISNSKITEKAVAGKKVKYVETKNFKTGLNYINLQSGNIIYADFQGGKITSFKLTNSKGTRLGSVKVSKPGVSHFGCSGNVCACVGDMDCDDMFSRTACTTSICYVKNIGDPPVCICVR